uniref:Uncharacterized protein n=1 Tax=Caenorhabditis japonica TaxID=281687 RepID=A0A8R1ERZ4_CAEJA
MIAKRACSRARLTKHPDLILKHILLYHDGTGEGMAGRSYYDHLILHVRDNVKFCRGLCFTLHKSDIQLIAPNRRQNLLGIANGNLDVDLRILRCEFCQLLRQNIFTDGEAGPDLNASGHLIPQHLDLLPRFIVAGLNDFGMFVEDRPRFSQGHLLWRTMQQLGSQLILQIFDMQAHPRVGTGSAVLRLWRNGFVPQR